jgi:hypothetical protein
MTYRLKNNIGDVSLFGQVGNGVFFKHFLRENKMLQKATIFKDSGFGTRIPDIDGQQHKTRLRLQSYE